MKTKKFWILWELFTIGWTCFMTILFVGNFLWNYWGQGKPIARFHFDVIGEQGIESVLFPIWCVMAVLTFIRITRRHKVEWFRGGMKE